MQIFLIFRPKVFEEPRGDSGDDAPLVVDKLLYGVRKRVRRGKDEKNVPMNIVCKKLRCRDLCGEDYPAKDAGYD
jgi:hypothetical protein